MGSDLRELLVSWAFGQLGHASGIFMAFIKKEFGMTHGRN